MDVNIFQMALDALLALGEPQRLGFLLLGVGCGLVLGVVPGLGGLVGLTLLLPFTFTMDPYTAMAFLMGLASVSATSDSIPAIMFGVPGTVASAATIVDGYPMAQKGEAGRALGAAFTASVMGGVFGAALLFLMIPLLRPAILAIARPEMLAIIIFGISLASALAGRSQLRGLIVACIGLIFAMVGQSRGTSEVRWNFDTLYLYDGMHIVPITLGLFALPELADMIIKRTSIARLRDSAAITSRAQVQGMRDAVRHWFLVIRCALIGSGLGAVPGIGATVIDWVAYGHAARTCKGAGESFGTGDVRGVLASEASNNAKEGGALVPTIAFGIPGSASMALILAALLTLGVVPGPNMLTRQLDVTYTLVWSVALANIFGAAICFVLANQFAKIALVRIGLLGPIVLVVVFLGAFQGKHHWGDLYTFLAFGALGFLMKRQAWPRPPLILGVVLGAMLEDSAFIVANVYGWAWLARPIAAAILILTLFGVLRPMIGPALRWFRSRHETRSRIIFNGANVSKQQMAMAVACLAFFTYTLIASTAWSFRTQLVPYAVSAVGIVLSLLVVLTVLFRLEVFRYDGSPVVRAKAMDMDLASDFGDMSTATFFRRLFALAAWCVGLLVLALLIGLIPACVVFMIGFMRLHERESWPVTLLATTLLMGGIYLLFHVILGVSWAPAWIGYQYPWLRSDRWLSLV